MKAYFLVITVTLGILLILSSSTSMSYATHNSKDSK